MEAVRSRFSFITFKHNIIKVITWSFISVCHPKIWNDMLLASKQGRRRRMGMGRRSRSKRRRRRSKINEEDICIIKNNWSTWTLGSSVVANNFFAHVVLRFVCHPALKAFSGKKPQAKSEIPVSPETSQRLSSVLMVRYA